MSANITGAIIALGHNCKVVVDGVKTIALVASFQANEDFQVQDAICLNHLGPVSIDPQGYTCTITMDGFLPSMKEKINYNGTTFGDEALMHNVPSRDTFMNGSTQKFAKIDFVGKDSDGGDVPLASFEGVIVTSNGISAEGNSYVKNNVQMRALSWSKDGWNGGAGNGGGEG